MSCPPPSSSLLKLPNVKPEGGGGSRGGVRVEILTFLKKLSKSPSPDKTVESITPAPLPHSGTKQHCIKYFTNLVLFVTVSEVSEVSTDLNNFPENFNEFSFRPTTSSIVFTHLNRLSKTKSTGLDSISAKLIRECADIISGPLCNLTFNKSLMSGIFPEDWKRARVIPLFKPGRVI